MREVSMYAVQYRVTGHKGTRFAGLMYVNEQQGIEIISKSKLPWVKRFRASYGQHVTLQAQILSSGFLGVFGGEVTVEILVNGSPCAGAVLGPTRRAGAFFCGIIVVAT